MKRLLYVAIVLLSPILMGQGYAGGGGSQTTVAAGSGTGTLTLGGVLCKAAPAQATTGTSEEILATCTIPAATLSANGSFIEFNFFAHIAANGNNKRLLVRIGGIGGAIVADSGTVAHSGNNFVNYAPCIVQRLSATTATSSCQVWSVTNSATSSTSSTSPSQFQKALAVTWANANDFVITGTTAGQAGDLTLDTYWVRVGQ